MLDLYKSSKTKIIEALDSDTNTYEDVLTTLDSLGKRANPSLIELMQDESLQDPDSIGLGSIPLLAARILCERKVVEAFEPILKFLATLDPEMEMYPDMIASATILAREDISIPIDLYFRTTDEDELDTMREIFSLSDSKDPRIYDIFVEALNNHKPMSATYLIAFGGTQTKDIIVAALDSFEVTDELFSDYFLFETQEALESIGVELSPIQKQKIEQAQKKERIKFDLISKLSKKRMSERKLNRIGRNDLCPCDSGKKYKKCCL